MADIEKATDTTLEGLSQDGETILNYAYNQLKNGDITRLKYLEIVNRLDKWDDIPYGEISATETVFWNIC
ncbi:hypothetical protein ACM26V_04195 [Salipaludibacillus sp. HK11]|uniref:hypothetical protein n=1 Tax=Salipaludibacillus sp. HK11 TaxID=3394320 RepID=UPI0039FC89A0